MPECSSATESFRLRVAGMAVFKTLCSSRFLHSLRIEAEFVGWVHASGITGAFNQIRVSPELLFLGLRSITKRWSMPVHDWKRPKPVRCWFRVKTGCVESVQYFVHGSDAVVKSRWTQFVGCSSLLIPLANYAAPNITRSNRANLVTALGFSANQSATRITFIAQAVSKCCEHVFSNPKYLERRNSNARTPTEMLPSIPALFAYSDLNASVSSRARAATRAS